MLQLKRDLLCAALASAMTLAATAAHAQTADAATGSDQATQDPTQPDQAKDAAVELDRVKVTGIRAGIESAIAVKRDATSIVEAVSSEDIGKLPDVSIAESIARLPGLAAQRVAGRAQVISVRGLSPDFATTLLNGRELVSTGDNRSVEFDQYPSELLSGVTVYKTPDAGLIGQGLSGTLDLRTIRPLSYDERVIAVSGRYQYNSLGSAANADGDGNRVNASYVGQFADRTLGLTLGYSHSDTPTQENQVGLYEPWKDRNDDGTPLNRPGLPDYTFSTDGIKALRRTGYTKRDGVIATLQYRPSNDWTSILDAFYSKAEQEDTANQWEMNTQYNGNFPCNPDCVYSNVTVNENGTLTGGTLSGVYPLVRGMYNKREDKIRALGWSNEFNLGSVRMVADLSWSKAKRNELNLENNTQLVPAPQYDTVQLRYRGHDFSQIVPTLDYSDPSKLFLRNTIYGSGYGKVPKVDDELKSAKLAASIPAPEKLAWFSDFDVGVNYADRSKKKRQPEGNINVGAQGDTAIASDLQYGLVDLGFAGIGKIPSWNVPAAVARYMIFNPSDDAFPYLVAKAWDVNEKTTTAFVKGNLNTQWGGVDVRGNVGVQVQRTDQSSDAVQLSNGGSPQPVSVGKTITDVLPSMNLAFMFENDQALRVALAKQVARPRVDQMRASLEVSVADSPDNTGFRQVSGNGGNPKLDPWRAYAFDVSYEKYFGNRAYFAAAYFYKDLKSYIYTQTDPNFDFTPFTANYPPPTNGTGGPIATTGNYTAPANGKGGRLSGFELTASVPLEQFTETLRGFGVVASASFTNSSIKIRDPESSTSVGGGDIELPGLSKRVYNVTAYYENSGFEARVSQRKRSDFIGEIGNFNGNRTLRYVVGEDIVDAQVGYTFGDGTSLKGLGFLVQVSNLTNAAYRTYFSGSKDRPLEYVEYGRTYYVGLNYKF